MPHTTADIETHLASAFNTMRQANGADKAMEYLHLISLGSETFESANWITQLVTAFLRSTYSASRAITAG